MPYVRIPPANLEHVELFGIHKLRDDGDFAWYSTSRGVMRVEKSDPIIWLDDLEDASQLGALDVIQAPRETL